MLNTKQNEFNLAIIQTGNEKIFVVYKFRSSM
jgi:hypothetical protein